MSIVVLSGLGAPNVLAQEWKTYINPEYKFTMQYPFMETGNSIFIGDSYHDDIPSEIDFTFYIGPDNNMTNIKPYVEKELQNLTYSNTIIIVKDIHPVTYSNMSGYEFMTYTEGLRLMDQVFLHHGNEIYIISAAFDKDNYSRDLFEQTLNSIKFF